MIVFDTTKNWKTCDWFFEKFSNVWTTLWWSNLCGKGSRWCIVMLKNNKIINVRKRGVWGWGVRGEGEGEGGWEGEKWSKLRSASLQIGLLFSLQSFFVFTYIAQMVRMKLKGYNLDEYTLMDTCIFLEQAHTRLSLNTHSSTNKLNRFFVKIDFMPIYLFIYVKYCFFLLLIW